MVRVIHGWEIAVILRKFRKTKLSKANYFIFFFFTLFQHVYNVQLDDFRFATYANIAFRHFTALRPPSCHLPLHTHDTNNIRAWNSSRKRGFSQKGKSKIAEKIFFRGKQIHKHTLFFKQSVDVAENMEITRERMRVCQQNRALMELSFVDICIF